jgi:hypothetical protein
MEAVKNLISKVDVKNMANWIPNSKIAAPVLLSALGAGALCMTTWEYRVQTLVSIAIGGGLYYTFAHDKVFRNPAITTTAALAIAGLIQGMALPIVSITVSGLFLFLKEKKFIEDATFNSLKTWEPFINQISSLALSAICYAGFRSMVYTKNDGLSWQAFHHMAIPMALSQTIANIYFRNG